jgi:Domain of unknown function (DUF4160)
MTFISFTLAAAQMSTLNTICQNENATININNGNITYGALSPKQLKLVTAWIEIHKDELFTDWVLCKNAE